MPHQDDPWLEKVSDSDVVDPLSGPARSERTALMASNLIFFAVFHVGISPEKFEIFGAEIKSRPKSFPLLVCIVLVYYGVSFGLTVGAELRAWKSRLETLRERRQLRAEWLLLQRLAAPREFDVPETSTPEALEARRTNMIIASNRAQQLDWAEYQRMYRLRMWLDGFAPLVLTIANAGAALVRLAI